MSAFFCDFSLFCKVEFTIFTFFAFLFAYIKFFLYLCSRIYKTHTIMIEQEIKEKAAKELAEQVMHDCYAMCGIW